MLLRPDVRYYTRKYLLIKFQDFAKFRSFASLFSMSIDNYYLSRQIESDKIIEISNLVASGPHDVIG